MSKKISIAIDAMGGDNSPDKTIEGIKLFLKKNSSHEDFILNIFGKKDVIVRKINELNINQNSEHVLSDYLYFKFNYVNVALRRHFESFMSDIRYSEYPRYPEAEDTVNNFYRFSKTWAKKKKVLYDKAWNLKTQDQFIELRDLANKPFSDELLKMQDINKVEEKLTSIWTKT